MELEATQIIYNISSPIILLAGFILAYFQLKAFRKEARTKHDKEAKLLSISILEEKLKSIDKHQNKVWEEEVKPETPEIDISCDDFEIVKKGSSSWIEWMGTEKSYSLQSASIDLLNELETLSQYIFSGLTDEELCFTLEGELIVDYIESNKHYISFHRVDDKEVYSTIIKLYDKWIQDYEVSNLIKQKNKIEKELSKVQPPSKITKIGVD